MHSEFCTDNHQRVAHIVSGVSEIRDLFPFQLTKMLFDCKHIRKHLRRMIFVRQTVPYRNTGILRQLLHLRLGISAVLDTVIHPAKHARCILDTLLFSDLGSRWIEIRHMHSKVMSSYFKRTSRTRTCFFKNKRNILSRQIMCQLSRFLFCFQICRQIKKI